VPRVPVLSAKFTSNFANNNELKLKCNGTFKWSKLSKTFALKGFSW